MRTSNRLVKSLGSMGAALLVSTAFSTAFAQESEIAYATQELGLPAELVAAACAEGKLGAYHLIFRGELQPLFAAFTERFPCITVEPFMASGGQLAQRFTSEQKAGVHVADIWMNSSPAVGTRLAKEGVLMNFTPPNADRVGKDWKHEGYWYGMGLTHLAIAWNTEEITAEQKAWIDGASTWDQIFTAPFEGNLGMVDVRAGGSTQLPYYFFKEAYGIKSWEDLKKLKPTIFSGINPMADRLAAGEFAFSPHATSDTALDARRIQGAPLQWKFLEPGLAIPYFVTIASTAPHPNAAKLFLTWSLSKEGQTLWVRESGLSPAGPDVPDEREVAQTDWYKLPTKYYTADWDAIEGHLDELYAEFQSVFGQ